MHLSGGTWQWRFSQEGDTQIKGEGEGEKRKFKAQAYARQERRGRRGEEKGCRESQV